MIFKETSLRGAFIVEPELVEDNRGFFARIYSPEDFEAHGLCPSIVQSSISYNKKKGTLRGMHYQVPPRAEEKLVRCTMGSIFDVIVDLRPDSKTYLNYNHLELSSSNRTMLYIPKGFAHGYITLEDNAEVTYQISEYYTPQHARGIRWDDPVVKIEWPMEPVVISERDKDYPNYIREHVI
jgi:dTDP-4-dehydrorhamnose 3,5-epimerase